MPEISKITLPSGTTYDLKDSTARAAMSGLGDLATKDSASGTYTPAGSVSVTPTTTTAYVAGSADGGGSVTAGTACTMPTYTVSNETLIITGGSANTPTAVTLPSFSSQTVATGVDSASFTGTEATITVS